MNELCLRLDKLLESGKITRTELSRKVSIPESTLRSWYTGVSPKAESLYKVAIFFGVTVEFFLKDYKDIKNSGTSSDELNLEKLILLQKYEKLSS